MLFYDMSLVAHPSEVTQESGSSLSYFKRKKIAVVLQDTVENTKMS